MFVTLIRLIDEEGCCVDVLEGQTSSLASLYAKLTPFIEEAKERGAVRVVVDIAIRSEENG